MEFLNDKSHELYKPALITNCCDKLLEANKSHLRCVYPITPELN